MKQLLIKWEFAADHNSLEIKNITGQTILQHIEEILVIASKFVVGSFKTLRESEEIASVSPIDRQELINFFKLFASQEQKILQGLGTIEIWINVGGIAENLGLSEEAETFYRIAIYHDSKNAKAWSSLGYILETREKFSEAAKAYDRAYALERDEELMWDKLVTPREIRDTEEEAVKTYEDAFGMGFDDGNTWLAVGISKSEKKDYAGAIIAFEKGLQSNPKNSKLWYQLGVAYDLQGDEKDWPERDLKVVGNHGT